MCGICGFTGKSNAALLKKMADALVHRGPDEQGFYSDDQINLGIRRLSIIDVKMGHQPIHNEDKRAWVVFNGEIYNFQELRKDLETKGHRFYTDHADTEVIVHLYEEEGINFVHRLNGMFAIALWDAKTRKLFLWRDRMGVKPLFYAMIEGELIFGSEIKAILNHPSYRRRINYEAIFYYLSFKNIPSPLTAFDSIFSLLPGERLEFAAGTMNREKWWKISFSSQDRSTEEELLGKLRFLIEDATRLRMTSDVPFGAYLSGGVDSSTIVAYMTRYTDKPVKTFSLGYEDELKNKAADLYYARRVSKLFKTDHREYIMSSRELVGDIDAVVRAFDQPFSGTISTFFLSKLIRQHVKLALSGDGADELFGSYLSHRMAQPMAFLKDRHASGSASFSGEEVDFSTVGGEDAARVLFEKSGGRDASWRYHLYPNTDAEKRLMISDSFRERLGDVSTQARVESGFERLSASDPLNRILEYEWNTQFPDQVLSFVDALSMAHSVEIRSPFIDYRLVELAASIPGALKIRGGRVKDILKKAVVGIIPEEIAARPKEGFVLPIFDWMVDQMKDYCCDVLSRKRLERADLLRPEVVLSLQEAYYGGQRSFAGKIWNLVMLQIWWETYFG